MKFGLIQEGHIWEGETETRRYHEMIEEAVLAEDPQVAGSRPRFSRLRDVVCVPCRGRLPIPRNVKKLRRLLRLRSTAEEGRFGRVLLILLRSFSTWPRARAS